MSIIVDDPSTQIAERISTEREQRGWSLADLSERSGVSKAMLSKIEREEASPTATILTRIATAFELTLAGLLENPGKTPARLSRRREQPRWQDPATGYVRQQVFQNAQNPLELVEVHLPPGARVALPRVAAEWPARNPRRQDRFCAGSGRPSRIRTARRQRIPQSRREDLPLSRGTGPAMTIRALDTQAARDHIEALAHVLHDCVEGGASVSFMWPFDREQSRDYWIGVVDALGMNRLRLYAAFREGTLAGTVQLWLDGSCNQKHRGDIRKLLVHREFRRLGLARDLMHHAETQARALGLSLLTLDTVTASPAEILYTSLGWQRVGVIPDYAKWPDGRFCDATVLYKTVS
jgi:transcriptional regulator with XRE-family HTH domain/GNAT superfamily N-acetyltransferase